MRQAARFLASVLVAAIAGTSATRAADLEITLPPGFETAPVVDGLLDPATMAFAPDGRLFIGERIQGTLRVAVPDGTGGWSLLAEPFHVFEVPHDGTGVPERHRSSGVRGFAFDPDIDGDGLVGVNDLLALLANRGPCRAAADCPADLDRDCTTGLDDLLVLLAAWG